MAKCAELVAPSGEDHGRVKVAIRRPTPAWRRTAKTCSMCKGTPHTAPVKSGSPACPPVKRNGELGHVSILLSSLRMSPENERLYRPVREDDSEIRALAQSIQQHGVMEPLVVSADNWVLSGHRRLVAARVAGLSSVPCRIEAIVREDDPDGFLLRLREYNRQRDKDFSEKVREEVVNLNPTDAYQSLIEHRARESKVTVKPLLMGEKKRRSRITKAKEAFLGAVLAILESLREFWPVSDRQLHYPLLNDPPLRHASKPESTYRNDLASYKSLCDLLTRARLDGSIPMEAIGDETRPVQVWNVWRDVRGFVREELDDLCKDYWRDLMQSQGNAVEILVEKNTVANIVKPVAGQYCIPMTSGRGYCSLPPRHAMAERFRASGKTKLIVLIVSDFDPDGEVIAESFGRSMRDDFGVAAVWPIKVALTAAQVKGFKLPPQMLAKETSKNYARFVRTHGTTNAYELEAITPLVLQGLLRDAIDAVIDRDAFNRELDQEKKDAVELGALRRTITEGLAGYIIP